MISAPMLKRIVVNRKQPQRSVVQSASGRAVPYTRSHDPNHLGRIMSADTVSRASAAFDRVTSSEQR
jgi:hypothetical protein